MSQTGRRRTGSDAKQVLQVLARFTPRARRAMGVTSFFSFVSGMTEAGILVTVTAVAISTTKSTVTGPEASGAGSGDLISLGPFEWTPQQVLLLAGALLITNLVIGLWSARYVSTVATRASLAARGELLMAFHRSTYERKSQDRVAVLQEALTTYVDRFTMSFGSLSNLTAAVLSLASFAIASIIVSPGAAIALALIGLLMVVVLRPATKRTRRASLALSGQRRQYASAATESVLLSRELAVFGVDGVAGERLRTIDEAVGRHYWRSRFLMYATPRVYQTLAFGLAITGLFVLTGMEVDDLTALGAVVLLLVRSLSYGQQLLASVQQLSEHRSYVDRLTAMLDSYEESSRRVGSTPTGELDVIALSEVGFAYPDSEPALHDVDLQVRSGEAIGIVGPSGAGKTTLVNVLLRLYAPSTGTITVNGVPLAEVDDEEWHRRTAIVPQEPRLIHGTIADNIRFLRDISDEAVEEAGRAANIDSFVRTLPDGYDSKVGELGLGLSGGQRQRICIARALAGDPDLLVLDEPTSALDGESEAAIQRTLEALRGRVTMILVAHRLSTLSICDRLVVLRDGEVAADGTAEELAESSPYYREAMRLAGL